MNKLKVHILVLPRWFALPIVLPAVVLGGILMGGSSFHILLACFSALLLMAGAHSFNTFLDYSWTKLDQGQPHERSKPKAYTSGQQPIASGLMAPREVLINALAWYALSAIPAILLYMWVTPWIIPMWIISSLTTFWYSWGKLHYQCEMALGLGFGSFGCMIGACASPNPNLLVAFLAGLPIVIVWGFAAEVADQAMDAEANWDRGLRNLGAWAWKNGVPVPLLVILIFIVACQVQSGLVVFGILAPETIISLIAAPILIYGAVIMGNNFNKVGVLLSLGAVFIYMIALPIGQALSM